MIRKNKVTQSSTNIADQKKWVINVSSRQLTHIETDLLANSLNFSITSKTLPNKNNVATIEDAVTDFEKKRLTRFVPMSALHFKTPLPLRIISPRMNAKL